MNEDDFQISIAAELTAKNILWTHVANEGQRNIKVGQKNKRKGLKRGVPDILIFDRPPNFPHHIGVAIELKIGNNQLTSEQETWLVSLEKLGWYTTVCWTIPEWDRTIRTLGW